MKLRFLLVLIISSTSFAFAQHINHLFSISDIRFTTDYEKAVAEKIIIQKDSSFVLEALLAGSKDQTEASVKVIMERIDKTVQELKNETDNQKLNAKKIKIVYTKVHSSYLKKFELKSNFAEIFSTGTYNCVTATALYAHILQKLAIPYTIKELPTHVYLIAYPDTEKLMIETTNPTSGYFQFSDDFIKAYLTSLEKNKLISKEERSITSANELFNKYYFANGDITLKKLAGIHYSNLGLYVLDDKNYTTALENFKKSYLYYSSPRITYVITQTLRNLCSNANYLSENDISHYISLLRLEPNPENNIAEEELAGEFERITKEQLISKSNVVLYDETFKKIAAVLDSGSLKNKITISYRSHLGYFYYDQGKYSTAESHLKEAYKLGPDNIYINGMLRDCIRQKVITLNNSQKILDLITKSLKEYPSLKSNNFFTKTTSLCYLDLAYQNFYINDIIRGESYLAKFETESPSISTEEDAEIDDQFIEKAYSNAAVAYFKKGNKAKAKSVIVRGLKYSPSNVRLKMLLSDLQ